MATYEVKVFGKILSIPDVARKNGEPDGIYTFRNNNHRRDVIRNYKESIIHAKPVTPAGQADALSLAKALLDRRRNGVGAELKDALTFRVPKKTHRQKYPQ